MTTIMKHFFFLLLASICLNASADVLDVNRDELLNTSNQRPRVLRNNDFVNQLQFNGNGSSSSGTVTPTQNSQYDLTYLRDFLNHQSSTNSHSNTLMRDKIVFFNLYDWDTDYNGQVNVKPYGNNGGWTTSMRDGYQNNYVYGDNLFIQGISQKMYIDYSNNSVWMPTFTLLGSIKYNDPFPAGYWNDTLIHVYMINEDYLTRNAEPANIHGTLYDDGSVTFEDGLLFYYKAFIHHYFKNRLTSIDTVEYTSYIIRDVTLVVPNAKHEFKTGSSNYATDAYMFQADDTTRVVMNLWGLGGHYGNVMYLHEDGSMRFPFQLIRELNVSQYNFDDYVFYPEFYNFAGSLDYVVYPEDSYGTITDGVITWGTNTIADFYNWGAVMLNGPRARGGLYPGAYFGIFGNNRLYYTEPNPEPLLGDINGDGKVSISDVTTMIDMLLNGNEIPVWNDINGDGHVTIGDVTALVDIILNGAY